MVIKFYFFSLTPPFLKLKLDRYTLKLPPPLVKLLYFLNSHSNLHLENFQNIIITLLKIDNS